MGISSLTSPNSLSFIKHGRIYPLPLSQVHHFESISKSGGTDIMCCCSFSLPQSNIVVGAVPSWPLYAGEIQSKSLGMAVEVYSASGSADLEASGQPGELVCTMPFPSMPLVLWGDRTGETYRKAYFDKFPGVWHHGDFLAINPITKGIIMLGRR